MCLLKISFTDLGNKPNKFSEIRLKATFVCTQNQLIRGGSRISGKGVRMYKGVGVSFAHFISFFLNIP